MVSGAASPSRRRLKLVVRRACTGGETRVDDKRKQCSRVRLRSGAVKRPSCEDLASKRQRWKQRAAEGVAFDVVYNLDALPFHTITSRSSLAVQMRAPEKRRRLRFIDLLRKKPAANARKETDEDPAVRISQRNARASTRSVCEHANSDNRLLPLTPAECEVLEQSISDTCRANVEGHGATSWLGKHDFARLLDTGVAGTSAPGFLNDEIVNAYGALLNQRNSTFFANVSDVPHFSQISASRTGGPRTSGDSYAACTYKGPCAATDASALVEGGRKRTYIFNTYFYSILTHTSPQDCSGNYDYGRVKRWWRRRSPKILGYAKLLIPVNFPNTHWVLAGVDVENHRFVYLDSYVAGDSRGVIPKLRQWFADEVTETYGEEVARGLNIPEWRTVLNPPYIPRQRDANSCGLFVMLMADYLELGKAPAFTQSHIPLLRKRTALYLLSGVVPES